MKKIIDCALCEGQAQLQTAPKSLIYRGEAYDIMQYFYKCLKCHEEFTTDTIDEASLRQALYQYRAKHRIAFADEITAIREQYGFSAKKMSELLGMGDNQYALYERGDMPSPSNANLIRIAADPKIFLQFIEGSEFYTAALKEKILTSLAGVNTMLPINTKSEADKFTGFRKPNWSRVSNMLLRMLMGSEARYNTPLKLNKMLFYTDFLAFKNLGRSLTGLTYRAIQWGPVPTCYDNIYNRLITEGVVNQAALERGDDMSIIFSAQIAPNLAGFEAAEIMIIETVIEKFKKTSTAAIIKLSHEERAWKEQNAVKGIIDYHQYAHDLYAFA